MRSVDELVASVRGDSRNEDAPSATSRLGIPTSDIVRYFNYAQQRLQAVILKANPGSFQLDYITNTVAQQEAYTVADRVYAGERIVNVQYSHDGTERAYQDIPQRANANRNTNSYFIPAFYIRRSSTILLNPIPTSATAKLRITYERQLDDLATRNGLISSATGSVIQLSSPTTDQESLLQPGTYVCVSNPDGTPLLYNGKIQSYNAGTDQITLTTTVASVLLPGVVLADLANAYVTIGRYTTTHSKLSDICERYLEVYANMKMFVRDSGNDKNDYKDELAMIEQEILQSYQDANRDELNIQIIDPGLVIRDGWGW